MRIRPSLIVPVFLLAGRILAQEPMGESVEKPVVEAPSGDRLSALQQVVAPLSETKEELAKLRAELDQAASGEARENIQMQIDAERKRARMLRDNFRDIVGGAEAAEYEGTTTIGMSFEQQVVDLFQPLVSALREASSSPRELEVLRTSLDRWQERKRKAEVILRRIDQLKAENEDPNVTAEFDSARKFWEGRKAECTGQIGVVQAQLAERENRRRPFWEVISDMFSRFFKSRGLNLILAALTGVLSYLLVRRIYNSLRKVSPVHRKGKGSLASRISDIAAIMLAVFFALWGMIMVFYIRGDWLLLTLVVLLLIGAAWAGKASLPPYVEQIRTLLNLGSIREGERVVYQGLPWQVQAIGFFTSLRNPNLQGGELRIPIRQLMGMMSRDPDPKEPWFPTEVDDWVIMGDETYGKVVTQTPEQVVVLQLGGSLKTYPSSEFLAGMPINLAHGFRVACVFGIDYMHQAVSTSEVPEVLLKSLTGALVGKYGRDPIRSINVEFCAAGASSLDYQILVDVSGELGPRYQSMQRLIQKTCVDTCNENGWVIPFTQITVHRAEDQQTGAHAAASISGAAGGKSG